MRRSLRAILSKGGLLLMRLWMPSSVRRRELEELFSRTAAAFGKPKPPARGRSVRERLQDYALATSGWAEGRVGASGASQILRTLDGGITWRLVSPWLNSPASDSDQYFDPVHSS